MLVDVRFDTKKLTNEQIEQINSLIPFAEWSNHVKEKPAYSNHMIKNVKKLLESKGLPCEYQGY